MRTGLSRALTQHRKLALAVFAASQLVALGYWVTLPSYHLATALVLTDTQPSPVRAVQAEGAGMVIGARAALLMSDLVAERVVRRLQLEEVDILRQAWVRQGPSAGSFQQWLIRLAQGGLVPSAGRGGYLLQVGYAAPDAGFARTMANAYAEELVAAVDRLNKLDDQALESPVAQSLEASLARMRAAHDELTAVATRSGVLLEGLTDPGFVADSALQRQTVEGLVAARQALATAQVLQAEPGSRAALDDPVLQSLRVRLADLSSRRDATMTQQGVNHPAVASLEAAIQRTQQDIQAHLAQLSRSMGAMADIQQGARLQRDQVGVAARDRLLGSLDDRAAFKQAQSRFDAAAEDYIVMATNMATLAYNRDASKSDMVLVEAAPLPHEPWFPRAEVVWPTALGAGGLFAVLAALMANRFGRRVASADDLRGLVGADLVAVLPADRGAQRSRPAGSAATRSSWLRSAIKPLLSPLMPWRRSRSVLRK